MQEIIVLWNGGGAGVRGSAGDGAEIEIPSEIDGKSVTGIGYGAFRNCSGLTSITIPASVTSIGIYVFDGCSGLKSIQVAEENESYVSEDGVLYNKEKSNFTAAENAGYKAASKTVTLTVKPKKASLVSVKSKKKKTALVKWKRDAKASGYLIECATDKKFKKNKVKMAVSKNKTVSATVKKLKGGKKYYVRVCAYTKDGKNKIQGDWSRAKTVKVKK